MTVMPELGLEPEISSIEFNEIDLNYSEKPDEEYIRIADIILDRIKELSEKIYRFIRQNNIYGSAYKYSPESIIKENGDYDFKEILEVQLRKIEEVLKKNYFIDVFSDGTDEIKEMLRTVWRSLEAVLKSPLFIKTSSYVFDDGTEALNEDFSKELLSRISKRYSRLDDVIFAYDFLSDKTENELFQLYDRMIELDTMGLMKVNRNELIKIGESEQKLNELIGLKGIKDTIKKIKAYALANKDSSDLNIHMCFLGNPGCGKTEVARYIAGILYENKILSTKKIVEVDRSGLVSEYFGATAAKTSEVINRAMGGVLFIDEAYALGNNSDSGITDYGKEAIDTLVKAMEDYRGKFCVILAGYKNEMESMLATNPGFKSRIQFTLDFPNYTREELMSITEMMLRNRNYTIGMPAMNRILDITDVKRKEPNFANAREIRNILDQVIMCQNMRCAGTDDRELGLIDVNKYIDDSRLSIPTENSENASRILTGEEELERLIGLDSVKRMIKKIKAYAKRNKGEADFNMHMCFYGNPGTGKTEVARILSRILYDAGVLKEAKLVETDGQGLIGKYVGETSSITEAKINDAMNGVLFIDEAYSLTGINKTTGSISYGDEAIAVLLKQMEDHRGQFCVILAGYKDEIKDMLSSNPGFQSRIQFTLEFPDYSRKELGEIAVLMAKKKKYIIDEAALEKLLDVTDYYRNRPNFANARTVRNVLDQVIMNQNLRTEDEERNDLILEKDVEDYILDEGIDIKDYAPKTNRIGFR